MKNSRRFLALMLAFLLAFGNLSTVAMAAEGEGAGIQQTEPVSAEAPAPEAPPADAGTEAVPTEPVLEQAPAEPAQNAQPAEETQPAEAPAEVPAEASSPEEAPASEAADAEMNEYSSAEAAPETEQPAAEPGVGGFMLPGVEVPEAPETEIVAPEPQADPSTNADNGIMPIATNWSVDMKLEKLTEGTEFEVGDKVTYRLTAKNTRLIFSIDDLDLTISGVTGIQTGKVEVPRGSSYTTNTTSPDGWHVKDIPVNGTVTIEFSYTITEADVAKGETLTVTAKSETGRHETASESQDVHITLKRTALKVEVTGEKKTVTYNGTAQTADQYTVTVTNKNTSAAIDSSAVSVTVDDGYKASGTDADTYLMDLLNKVHVSVSNDKVYTLDQTDVTVTDGSLTIEPANVTIIGPKQEMTYGDEKPEIGDATITGLVDPDKGEGLKVSVAGPDSYDAGEHPLAVTYDANKNYNVTTKTDGSLTIEQRPITVKVKPAADVYVGDESPVSVELVEQPANLVKDHVLTLSDAAGTVDTTAAGPQGISDVNGNVKITDSEGHDVTQNYKVTYAGTAEVKAKYTITVSVEGGTADPAGLITVPSGKDQTIKFTPNKYYTLGTVTVDGKSDTLAANGSYTFTNVTRDHRIEVVYVLDTYTVTLHNGDSFESKRVTAGGSFMPETPALRDDAVFSGWATEEGGDVVYTPGTPFTVEGNTDLYAVWTAKKAQTYTCYVTIYGIPEETAMDCFAFSGTSISFDLYEKKAGTDEYVLKERKTLAFSELNHISPWPTYFRLNMTFDGYKEDAYQVRNITFSNEEVVGDPSKGEYKLGPVIATPSDRDIKSTVQEIHSLSYRAYPTYGITINLKIWTDENTSTPVIKSFQYGTRYHDGEEYDVSDVIPESVEYEGHNYIPVYDGHAVSGTIHKNDVTINKTYARDDNHDSVPDVCQTIITYKVVNGAWDDGGTEDRTIEYRFYEQNSKGKWVRKSSLVSKPGNGLWLPTKTPGVGANPDDGYAEGSWDENPPTELKWLFSGDAGKHYYYTYTYDPVVTVSVTGGSSDHAGQNTVKTGGSFTAAFTADDGYTLERVTVDDAERDLSVLEDGSYTFSNVTEPHTIDVLFTKDYVVTLRDGDDQESVRVPQKSGKLTAPAWEKEGYLFMGWAGAEDGEVVYEPDDEIQVDGDMDLYAVWHDAAVLTFYMDVYNLGKADIETLRSQMSLSGEIMNRDNSFYGRSLGNVTLAGSDAAVSPVGDGIYRLTWNVTVDGTVLKDIAKNGDTGPNASYTVQLYYKGGFTGIDPVGTYKLSGQDSLAPGKNDPRMTSKSSSSAAANDGEGNPIGAYMGRLVYMRQDAVAHKLTVKYVRDTDGYELYNSAAASYQYKQTHAAGAPYDVTGWKFATIKNGRTGNVNYAFDEPETAKLNNAPLTGIMPDEDLTITLVYSEDKYRPNGTTPGYSDDIADKYQTYDQDVYVDFFYADGSDLEHMTYTRSFTLGGTTFELNWNEHGSTEIVDKAGYGEGVFAQPDRLRVHWTVKLPLVDKANTSNKPIPGAAAAISADGYTILGGNAAGAVPTNAFYNSDSYCVDSYTFYALIMYRTVPTGAGNFEPAYYQYLTPHESQYSGAAGYLPKEVTVTENTGYKFLHWEDAEGNVVSNTASFTPTLDVQGGRHVNATYTAVFEEVLNTVQVEYYYDGELGGAPNADAPTEIEGRVGSTVTLTPNETLRLTYGKGTTFAANNYELDTEAGDTYKTVVKDDGTAVIQVHYKRVMVTGTGRLNIVGLPRDLLPEDATLSFTVKWTEVTPNAKGVIKSSPKSERKTYTFGELLDMNILVMDEDELHYHFNVPITVPSEGKGYVAKNPSASGYDVVYGYDVVMTAKLNSDSNKITSDGYSVGMLYSIQYKELGEHRVIIHYVDKLTGKTLQSDFVSDLIHGDDTFDFTVPEHIPETITGEDGTVYKLFVSTDTSISKAKGTMKDKDIEVTAYYSPDKNVDGAPDAAQVFLTFHVVNGAWNDETRDDVTKTIDVYKYNEDKGSWTRVSTSRTKVLPAVGEQPNVGFLSGYAAKNWNYNGAPATFNYNYGGKSFECTYTYQENPNFIPTASVSVEDTTYGEPYEPTATTPTGPHGDEYVVSYTYYTANADGTKGEALDGQPTDAGSYIVEATWTEEGRPDVTAEARFTIAKKAVTVTADNKSKVYGESDPDLTFTVPADALVDDDTADDLGVALEREPGGDVKTYAISGTANSSNYAVTVEQGTLTITKRPVTLTSAGDTKEYDGKPLTNETVTVSGDGFAEGEGAAYSVTGSQTLVGSSANEFTYTLNENTKADNYEITTKKGTLTVTDRTEKYVINMQPNGGTVTYDGEGHSVSGFAAQNFTVDGNTYTVTGLTASASGTNAGTYPVQITGEPIVRDAEGNDVTGQFHVTYGSASLVIGKAAVTVKPADASKVYDGEPLTANVYEVTAGQFYGNDAEKYTFTYGGSQTVAGSSASSVTVTLKDGEADNYTITAVAGALAVTDRGDAEHPLYAIGMQPIGGTATYDGAPHSAGGFAAQSFTVEGKTYTVEGVNAGVTATNAGTYPVQITGEPIVRDAEGNDVTKQFNVTYGSASLVIGRKAVTVTANNAGKVYGTNDPASFTAAVTGLVGSDRLNYSVTREAGENVGTYAIIPGGAAVQGNYDVTYVNGAFTITSQAITGLTVNGPANVVYDGAAHQWAPTVTGANGAVLQAGRDYNVAYNTGNFTDAGTVNVTITGTGNYSGSVTRTYQITPRAVTLTSATATKVYDGAALTAGNVTAEGFVPGEGAAFNVTGGRTIVGTSLNTFTYTLNANTNAANYVIGQTFGTLTVTPAALTVNVPANTVYDGAAHQWAPTVTGVNGAVLQAGRDYNVAYGTGNFTDAGTVNVTVTGAGNYTGTVTRAYTITPRAVTMTSASATRAYNGAALTAGNVTVEGFADGEGATYNVTGGRTIVGTSLNTFTYTLNANTDADNYNISRTFGTLTVTPAALTVNVPANTVYDGTAHQWAPTVTGANGAALQAGRDYNVAYSTGNFTDAGTVNVTITGAGNYTGTVTRTYTITRRDVTLTSASATKVYDGTALTAGNVTAQGFAPGEGATYNVTGRRTIVGTSLNAFTYTLNANTDAGNYNISRVFGRLVVTQAEGPAPDEGPNGPDNGPDNGPGNGPDNGPGNGPDNDVNPDNEANTADITEDEVPLGGEPEIEAASEDIPEDDVPMGAQPDKEQEYSLSEEVVISEDETPLGAAPTEADCCILHFILMLCALGVAVYYTYDRKRHQKREFELRSELK